MTNETGGCSVIWKIENLFYISRSVNECIESSRFTTYNLGNSEWTLRLYPKGYLADDDNFCLYLINHKLKWQEIQLDLHYKLLNMHNVLVKSCVSKILNFQIWHCAGVILLSKSEFDQINMENDFITIICHFESLSQEKNLFLECDIRTVLCLDKYLLKMDVPDYEFFKRPQTIKCPYKEKCPFEILISDDVISIKVIDNYCLPCYTIRCEISVLSAGEIVLASKLSEYHFNSEIDVWIFPHFIPINVLKVLRNAKLSFQFYVPNGAVINEVMKYDYYSLSDRQSLKENQLSTLQTDLKYLCSNRAFSDVELVVQGEIIHAHKVLLAARSPVFSAMFNQEMAEKQSGVVYISDIDIETLKSLVEFMYTNIVELSDAESSLRLLLAAEKYQVMPLKEECGSHLISLLTAENVLEVLSVADMVCHTFLKESAVAYIKCHVDEVLGSGKWVTWFKHNVELGTSIVCQLSANITKKTLS